MVVQVVSGQVADGTGLRRSLRPGRALTGGVPSDGLLVAVVRFEDEATARAAGPWWEAIGPVTVRESSDVDVLAPGARSTPGTSR